MGRYITDAEVKSRTAGKIRYATTDADEHAVGPLFLAEVIEEAESEVEMRLSCRYALPFVGTANEAFSTLTTNTQTVIKTLCRMEAVRRLLSYDFGRGTAVDGELYAIALLKDYENRMTRLVEYRKGQFGHFLYPPLEGLKLAAHNSEGDDGYAGRIYVSSDNLGGYAPGQMPSPGESFYNGELIDL